MDYFGGSFGCFLGREKVFAWKDSVGHFLKLEMRLASSRFYLADEIREILNSFNCKHT